MARGKKPKFVNVGGVRIRAGKTAAQVAEQMSRIDSKLYYGYGSDDTRRRAGDIIDKIRDAEKMDTRWVGPGSSKHYAYTQYIPKDPNAVYGATGSSIG